jgi:hypothetical protein
MQKLQKLPKLQQKPTPQSQNQSQNQNLMKL